MVIVLDSPGLKGVEQRHECERAHHVLHQIVLAEAAVAAVMANYKELRIPSMLINKEVAPQGRESFVNTTHNRAAALGGGYSKLHLVWVKVPVI